MEKQENAIIRLAHNDHCTYSTQSTQSVTMVTIAILCKVALIRALLPHNTDRSLPYNTP